MPNQTKRNNYFDADMKTRVRDEMKLKILITIHHNLDYKNNRQYITFQFKPGLK